MLVGSVRVRISVTVRFRFSNRVEIGYPKLGWNFTGVPTCSHSLRENERAAKN